MPEASVNGIRIHYVEAGEGPETIVFSHSYLVDHRHFEPQIEALSHRYRVLAYDHRDHGGSERVTRSYGMRDIYLDGLRFLESVASPPCHWIGLSTGGFVGVRLGIRRPDLLRSLVLMDTAADSEPASSRLKYTLMLGVVRLAGFWPVLGEAEKAMFAPETLRDPALKGFRALWRRRFLESGRAGTIRFGRAIFSRRSVEEELASIAVPTLVVRGEQDRAVGRSRARRMADAIPGARYLEIPGAGHLSTLEQPALVTEAIRDFLDSIGDGPVPSAPPSTAGG